MKKWDLIWMGNVAYFHTYRIEKGDRHGKEVYALGDVKTSLLVFEKLETLKLRCLFSRNLRR